MILESVRQALGANPNMLCGAKPVDVVESGFVWAGALAAIACPTWPAPALFCLVGRVGAGDTGRLLVRL
ncbi:hypothetical protein D9M68_661590 [compost metagenome]